MTEDSSRTLLDSLEFLFGGGGSYSTDMVTSYFTYKFMN